MRALISSDKSWCSYVGSMWEVLQLVKTGNYDNLVLAKRTKQQHCEQTGIMATLGTAGPHDAQWPRRGSTPFHPSRRRGCETVKALCLTINPLSM